MDTQDLPVAQSTRKLSRRHYFLVPLVSLSTAIVMFGGAEVITRIKYPEKDYMECRVPGAEDPRLAKPNCTVRAKVPEGPWVTYAMNECGYRNSAACGPKLPGTLRIALLGASMTMGKNVSLEDTWGERLGRGLSDTTQHKVEIQNLGWELLSPLNCYRQLPQVLALKPDLVIYAINPFDLARDFSSVQLMHRDDPDATYPRVPPPTRDPGGFKLHELLKNAQNLLTSSRAIYMAQCALFSNPQTFLRVYLRDGNRADYVRQPFTPEWRDRFASFNVIVHDMAARLRVAGVPLVIVGLPGRAQVVMVESGNSLDHTDPWAFDREIQKICDKAAVPYLPMLDAFSRIPNGDKLFYIVDTHITAQGHDVIARELLRRCLSGNIPCLQESSFR